ncbi:hypothetical protein HMPREF0973_00710 [Prevotella veroralis F0319]|uniref:Uncharacterized protein n=1 Tax=Prevotella veroralis F0319 TaxID=649761 RepID=C9MM80_9BACT|nr:hypothetical protein HMPREF0973_00710 [Prevotella veroralis F0319]
MHKKEGVAILTHPLFYFLYKKIYYICKQSDDIYGKSNQSN